MSDLPKIQGVCGGGLRAVDPWLWWESVGKNCKGRHMGQIVGWTTYLYPHWPVHTCVPLPSPGPLGTPALPGFPRAPLPSLALASWPWVGPIPLSTSVSHL